LEVEGWNKIVYPVSINYRRHWGLWESIREIVQNAMDAGEYEIIQEEDDLVIRDYGKGLQVRHLLFGVSEKPKGSRGQFGEGLKIALIVLKREGYDVEIKTKGLEIRCDVATLEGEKVLVLKYRKNGLDFRGTEVKIKGYRGSTFQDNFVNGNKDVVHESKEFGQIIRENPPRLYVKDIYIQDLDNAAFSYNCYRQQNPDGSGVGVRLEESRGVADPFYLKYEIGYLWSTVSDETLWEELFKAIKDKKWERNLKFTGSLSSIRLQKRKKVIRKAFLKVYGPDSVVKTDHEWGREAKWRGAKVVEDFDSWDHEELIKCLPTDKEYVIKDAQAKDVRVEDKDLTQEEFKNLELARELAKKVMRRDFKVNAYLMERAAGKAMGDEIRLDRRILSSLEDTLSTLIHELAHEKYNSKDLTAEMLRSVQKVGAELLSFYLKTMFEAGVLVQRVGKYHQYRISLPKKIAEDLGLWKGDRIKVSIIQ